MKKPIPVFWLNSLLDYSIGTMNNPTIWENRTELQEWVRCNSEELFGGVYVCHITEHPYNSFEYTSELTEQFTEHILKEFGVYDYEVDPLKPCGGWRSLDILSYQGKPI